MRHVIIKSALALMLALSLLSCDKTPHGVLSMDDMADLIVDLRLAEAYIENNISDYGTDSSKLVIKQSVFKKHGITQEDYDSSLVWYAHNMDDYIKANDKALEILKKRYDKINKNGSTDAPEELMGGPGEPTHNTVPSPAASQRHKPLRPLTADTRQDSVDLWNGRRYYTLSQGDGRGFITFDIAPDANKQLGDRYQLGYKLYRGGNQFKVSLSVDYSDGGTTQITRGTNSDGWVYIDIQSDSTRRVRRVYGYVSYDMKRGQVAYVDSLLLMRTRLKRNNYGIVHAQRHLERKK
jgi:hypothetical protein